MSLSPIINFILLSKLNSTLSVWFDLLTFLDHMNKTSLNTEKLCCEDDYTARVTEYVKKTPQLNTDCIF